MAAFAAAAAADPALGAEVADLAAQAEEQLARLRAAAPGTRRRASPSRSAARPEPTRALAARSGGGGRDLARHRVPGPVRRARGAAGLDRRGARGQDGRLA